MNFVAGAHAARAGHTACVIEGKERIRIIPIGRPAHRIVIAHRTDPIGDCQALQGIRQNDLPIILGVTLIAAFFIVFINLIVDLLYGVIDPRVRLG